MINLFQIYVKEIYFKYCKNISISCRTDCSEKACASKSEQARLKNCPDLLFARHDLLVKYKYILLT